LRSGTLPTHQVVGMGCAFRLAAAEMADDARRMGKLRDQLWHALQALPGVELNGDPQRRVPGILNVSFDGVEGESLLAALPELAVSSGSACASTHAEPSYVLRALGRSDQLAQGSIRFSLGRFTSQPDVDAAGRRVQEEVRRLRAIAPPPVGPGMAG
jgi:cysteine desulfurase